MRPSFAGVGVSVRMIRRVNLPTRPAVVATGAFIVAKVGAVASVAAADGFIEVGEWRCRTT